MGEILYLQETEGAGGTHICKKPRSRVRIPYLQETHMGVPYLQEI